MAGNLIGTKRISLLVEVPGLDALRMVSNRNIKISASIVVLPGKSRKLGLSRRSAGFGSLSQKPKITLLHDTPVLLDHRSERPSSAPNTRVTSAG